ncbi:MAG: hypothetical protein FWD75_03365 [Propionibacteriaceae bacterium]|nr:hypothetical protein [Propionibacteriaceae bacterium]
MRGFSGAFLAVSGMFYIMLMTNILIAVTCLPVWVLGLLVDLRSSWLWVAVFAILLAPALAGADAVFKAYSLDASTAAVRTFFRAWRDSWRRVGLVGLGFQAFFLVVGVDFYVLTLWGYGMLALPITIVLAGVGTVTAMVSWVGLMDRPDLTRIAVVKASLYLVVRKAGWSVFSLVILGVVGSVVWVQPALGLGLLLAPGLYVVWGNSRRTLFDLLPTTEQIHDDDPQLVRRIRKDPT